MLKDYLCSDTDILPRNQTTGTIDITHNNNERLIKYRRLTKFKTIDS